ncbi:Protein phosphatase PP2A regulatory subunit B [Sorochytrium milnesiophthora]
MASQDLQQQQQQQQQVGLVPAGAGAAAVGLPAGVAASSQPSASLYVGELDPSVTEAYLFEMFNVIGPVASVRVCRDAVTRRSLGYAYVNFHLTADGERALEQLNYTPIKGRPCRIMWSQRDPSLRKSGTGNIFIKNLDEAIDNKALHDTFTAFGNILSCKVATDQDGNSRGYGFVHYETLEAAERAIEAVNGMLLNDKAVYVGLHLPRKERQARIAEVRSKFTNLYVKNLPEEATEEQLRELFGRYGEITSLMVQHDPDGSSKGFGFINYADHEAAARAVDDLHDKDFMGKTLYVQRAQKKSEREEELRKMYEMQRNERMAKWHGTNLYVKNLDDSIDDEALRREFAPFGAITSSKVMVDDKGISRGFGFVCFSTPDEATKAVTEMNGKMIENKPIYVALAQRKDQRRAQLEAQHAQRSQYRMQPGQPMMPGVPGMYPGAPVYFAAPRGNFYPQGMAAPRPRWQQPGAGQPGVPMYAMQGQAGYPVPAAVAAPAAGGPAGMQMQGQPRPPRQMRQQGPPRPQQQRMNQPNMGGAPGAPANQTFKYTSNARNAQPGGAASGAPAAAAAGATGPTLAPELTPAALAAAAPEQQKRMLGEALWPHIHSRQPVLAGKITGMLLDMDNGELLHLLESPDALDAKVSEAAAMLNEHMSKQTTGEEAQ